MSSSLAHQFVCPACAGGSQGNQAPYQGNISTQAVAVRDIYYPERYRIDPMMVPMLATTGGFASAWWEKKFATPFDRRCPSSFQGIPHFW
jgi:hypothetical protein